MTFARLNLCALLCLAPVFPITARLFTLQIVQHGDLSSKVRSETERRELEITPRGRILDREGRVLAESLPAWSSYLDLKMVEEPRKAAKAIAPVLGMDYASVLAKAKAKRRNVLLKRKMTLEETVKLKALRLPGIAIFPDEERYYPNGDLARSLMGAVGVDGKGSAGLEFEFDNRIRGSSRKLQFTRDGKGNVILQDAPEAVAPPPDLKLTLDKTIQYYAEEEIAGAVARYSAKRGMVVVQDPKNGDILAAAVYPPDPLKNGVIQDVYEPGSTFKIVVAAAALETGQLKPEERIDCEGGRWQMAKGVNIKDHEAKGLLTLPEIIQYSSNIGSAKLGLALGARTFGRFCRLFGFGYKTGVTFPAESPGLLKIDGAPGPVRLGNAAFGQGVAVTPLQLVAAFSAIANDGMLMEPRLVLGVGSEPEPEPVKLRQVVSLETAKALRAMLELVVAKGTGVTAQIPGFGTAGKTGTAQKLDPDTKRYSAVDYVSSFAGYAPSKTPIFTILVVVDSPRGRHYGSEVAAPVFARLSQRILALRGVPPELPLTAKPAQQASAPSPVAAPAAPAPSAPKPPQTRPMLPRPSMINRN